MPRQPRKRTRTPVAARPDRKARAYVSALLNDVTRLEEMYACIDDLIAAAHGTSYLLVRVDGTRWRRVKGNAERRRLEQTVPARDRQVVWTQDPSPEAFRVLMDLANGPWPSAANEVTK